ncbi:MAG: PAS domain S-box protein [Desulfosarcinaceae bacterium]|nr:PAS domain S-box protein [Desulfosarcinaceae bacterium]
MENPEHTASQELERHLAILNATQSLTKVGGWQWDVAAQEMHWTDEVYYIHGLQPGDVPAGSMAHIERSLSCYDAKDRSTIRSAFENCARHGHPYDLEFPFTKVSGERIWIRTIAQPVLDGDQVVQVLGTLMDLTAHKDLEQALHDSEKRLRNERALTEAALRKSEAKMRTIFRAAPVGIGLVVNRVLMEANERLCEMTGYRVEELVGNNARMLYPTEEDYAYVGREKYRQIALRGTGTVETRFRRKDGLVIDVLMSSTPLDLTDLTAGVTFTALDITARKETEAALRTSEKRLQAILEASPDPVVVYDIDGHPQFLNPAFSDVFGWTLAELRGRRIPFVPQDQQAQAAAQIKKIYRSGGPVQFLSRRLTKAGDTIDVVISAAIIRGSHGKPVGMVVNLTNVSEQLRLEAQLQQAHKMESIGRLAGGVAHDFNNMLGVIIGHAELAMDRITAAHPVHADLKEIAHAAERSSELTKQLLAFARRQTAAPKILDLNDTIAGMLKMLRRLIGEEIDLAWQPGASLWPVKIDPIQLDQILANLCANARDAIDGVGRLTIETRNVQATERLCAPHPNFSPGDYVNLSVSDSGSGMDTRTRENLFEPFFTTKGVGQGTGLGLATVYGIVKQNHGVICVESAPGSGTRFDIYLPRRSAAVEKGNGAVANNATSGNETVLVVEDEAAILKLTKTVLERHGYAVLAAGRPSEALEMVARHPEPIDLLVTDVVMPEMNGKALKEAIEAQMPAIKALFMSGYTTDAVVHRGIVQEDVHFIQKPFTVNDFATKVREILETPPL